jgi:hypothetical protein
MRSPREYLAERRAWKEYGARLSEMDRELEHLEPAAGQNPSVAYTAAWIDRMSFAANCYPGAPDPGPEPTAAELASGEIGTYTPDRQSLIGFNFTPGPEPEAQPELATAEPEPEAEP